MSSPASEVVVFDAHLIEEREYWRSRLGAGWHGSAPWPDFDGVTRGGALCSLGYKFDAELSRALWRMSGGSAFLYYTILLAGLKVTLFRYSGQRRSALGSPALRQWGRENALVITAELEPQATFRELLVQLRETLLAAYARQRYPYGRLLKDLQLQGGVSGGSSLFAVAARLEELHLEMPAVGQSIEISFARAGEELGAEVKYESGRYREESVAQLLRHCEQLLGSAVGGGAEQRVSELELLSEAERRYLVEELNRTEREYGGVENVAELVAAQARRSGAAVAVEDEQERISYEQLERRAELVGAGLRRRGVKAEALVGVMMERSVGLVVGLLGVWKAGGAYVPLERSEPVERVREVLASSGISLVLTQAGEQAAVAEKLGVSAGAEGPRSGVAVVSVEELQQEGAGQESASSGAERGAGGDNLAYVIYTSGSTGKPKGVMISHRGLVNYLEWCTENYSVSSGEGVPVHSSIGFDLTVTGLFSPLLVGKTVVLVREDRGIDALKEALSNGRTFSLVKITPAHLEMLNQVLPPEAARAPGTLIVGGEALFVSSLSFWRTHAPGLCIVNEYGPTETVVGCCTYEIPANAEISGAVPIGQPIANTQIYLLDNQMRPVPKGVPSEIYIGGVGVARGYLNQPSHSAERFIPNPFSDKPGARLYRTGDLALRRYDDNIEYLGRLDSQVKIRGYRVELQEIEMVLSQHSAVLESVVLTREDIPGDKRLVAYVVLRPDHTGTVNELRNYLRERLPEYMVPSALVQLDAFPLTRNGKIDRSALPAPDRSTSAQGDLAGAPRSVVEELLIDIWTEVLNVKQVGVNDNFFDLGGHSLLATKLVSRVRAVFNVELPLRSLFDSLTIASLAGVIETALKTGSATEIMPIPLIPRREDVALSFAQQRLWFVQQMEPDNPFYNVTTAVRAKGPLNVAALESSFNQLIERHEVLRTSFTVRNGQPVGLIADKVLLNITVEDLSSWDAERREAELLKLCADAAHQPFDLSRVPLLRARIFKLSATEHVIVVVMHHLISDAWSAEILIREMITLYEAHSKGAVADLPELHIQYADYAAWQRNWLKGEMLDAQLTFWRRQLEGIPALLELPTDYPRPAAQTFRGARQQRQLPRGLSAALKELSRAEGVTLFMTLLTAFDILLSRYSGQKNIVVGSTIANRTRAETEGLIGFFVNTLVLRADLSGDPTFRELLRQVRETSLMAFTHQDLPFEMLVKELSPVRSLSHAPLFQVTFDLNRVTPQSHSLQELSLTTLALEDRTSKFDLSMTVVDSEEGLETHLQYSVDLFEPETIKRMLENFEALLESIVEDPGASLSTLRLLRGPEREQILFEWNTTSADYPRNETIHTLFERQAEARPDAVAMVYGNERLSFGKLNRRSNQLARYLQRLGARPEVPIGIYLERSTQMCIALLAVLKAGAPYLPLDPAYPKDRLAFMLKDARPSIILTEQRSSGQLRVNAAREVNIDTEWEQIARVSGQSLLSDVAPENSAYLIYTSGSTGKPKGVLSTHGALVNYTLAAIREFRLTPDDCLLQFAPLSFDVLIEELFPTWLSGGRVAIPNERVLDSFTAFLDFIEQDQVTLFEVPASFWHQWVQELDSQNVSLPSSLRLVIVGCEKMSPKYLAKWQKFQVPLIHVYGLTETTVTSMVHQMSAVLGERDLSSAPPVGRPIANTQAYLLDTSGQPVPVGVPGEIYIGGDGLGRGYFGRSELTAEKFVPNPFGMTPGERLYRTGDMGRYRSEGEIEFLGRMDEQVKIRGFRIEPGEIEAMLALHPSVVDVVVMAREDRPGDKRLAAYIVTNGQPAPTVAALHEHLRQTLPDYMIPAAFVVLEALPLTPSGKVDRRALPAPDRNGYEAEGQFVTPRTPVEQTLADIWIEVLGLDRVGIHDNFFHLGGHSLLAIQIVSRVRDAFHADLPLRKIFETPTIAGLSTGVVQTQAEDLDIEQAVEILSRLESLSAEEIQVLLAE